MKLLVPTLGMILVAATALAQSALTDLAQSGASDLRDVKTIYVAPMGGAAVAVPADMAREQLIAYLVQRGISVVDKANQADAILTGMWLSEEKALDGQTICHRLHGTMRLVSQNGSVLWTLRGRHIFHMHGMLRSANPEELGFWATDANAAIAWCASARFASRVAKRLAEAMADAGKSVIGFHQRGQYAGCLNGCCFRRQWIAASGLAGCDAAEMHWRPTPGLAR